MVERIFIEKTPDYEGKNVKICGWVHSRRDHGKIIFIDLRDRSGIIQVVFTPRLNSGQAPQNEEIYKFADSLRSEWVVSIEGKINIRPKGMQNTAIKTGSIEMAAEKLEVLNSAETPPFLPDTNGYEVNEENRLRYRYIDLRRPRLTGNIRLRHRLVKHIRDYLDSKGFLEIETPILTKSTPEGARDYVVPSRLRSGQFYALPQSPQQYKQLLMASGFEKYFQFARCFRDEDTRGDRQPEFTQMDLEMSFVKREDVMKLNEAMFIDLIKKCCPHKKIQEVPFPRISYQEAMAQYKTDRPDLREDKNDTDLLALCWIIDFPFFKEIKEYISPPSLKLRKGTSSLNNKELALQSSEGAKKWTFTHNPFSRPKDEHTEWLMKKEKIGEILTTQYDLVLNGSELGGGSIRNHQPQALLKVFEIMGYKEEEVRQKFGHMLEAFSYGTPPHGGIAWGFDRLVAILQNEPNIREVIAFPKTGDGRDLMMDAPSDLGSTQLKELGLSIEKKKK